ncbi:hypothetical protein LBMAG42_14690 [Deltaproteobacteria bacterium]|nr:hypothetical protein LBMAG42_14690 [Deltaproteobacteria bacterium]
MRMSNAHARPSTHTHAQARGPGKQAVNLTVSAHLLEEARELGIPLSSVLEEALREKVAAARQERWLRENRDALADYNERVEREGAFGDQFGNI